MKPVLVLATGPTLKQFEVDLFRDKCYVIAVNNAYKVCPWADEFYACDFEWWVYHGMNLMYLPGKKTTCRWDYNAPLNVMAREVKAVCDGGGMFIRRGWSMEKGWIYTGHNSGFQALQLAAQVKPPAIYLAGFDMGVTNRVPDDHFDGQHPAPLAVGSNYEDFIGDFETVIDEIRDSATVRLVTSPSGLSHLFDTVSVEDALHELSAFGGGHGHGRPGSVRRRVQGGRKDHEHS